MLNMVKEAMAPESSLPGRPACDVLNRDGISERQSQLNIKYLSPHDIQ
jgi:hypothetical protein